MNFNFNETQQVAADALDQMLARFKDVRVHTESYLSGAELDAELEASGFLEIGEDEDFGLVSTVNLIIQIARQGYPVEVASSSLVRPRFCPDAPRPLALVLGNGPVRFGAEAKTALIAEGSQVKRVDVKPGDFTPLETLFAYPLARLSDAARGRASVIEGDADKLRALWTLGLAAELVGAMDSTIQWTLDYVIQRKQFGRAIGSFQAVHHRLAECAVLRESARWLTLKAGGSGDPADAALASGFAQDAAKRVAYDAHQFHGAIGLTLEHPLHLWTYRLKALISELGGASAQFDAAAQAVWGA